LALKTLPFPEHEISLGENSVRLVMAVEIESTYSPAEWL
jgi:hypothetical protein